MTVYETLRAAVTNKRSCKVSKPGETERKICPYILGKSRDGEPNVLYYQYDGYSSRGLKEPGSSANWRCNRISDLSNAEIINEPWCEPSQRPKARGNCVASIDVEIDGYY